MKLFFQLSCYAVSKNLSKAGRDNSKIIHLYCWQWSSGTTQLPIGANVHGLFKLSEAWESRYHLLVSMQKSICQISGHTNIITLSQITCIWYFKFLATELSMNFFLWYLKFWATKNFTALPLMMHAWCSKFQASLHASTERPTLNYTHVQPFTQHISCHNGCNCQGQASWTLHLAIWVICLVATTTLSALHFT